MQLKTVIPPPQVHSVHTIFYSVVKNAKLIPEFLFGSHLICAAKSFSCSGLFVLCLLFWFPLLWGRGEWFPNANF